jgi:hypothetical protein
MHSEETNAFALGILAKLALVHALARLDQELALGAATCHEVRRAGKKLAWC